MKNVKKLSAYISLLFITTFLSGCGTVEHYYYARPRTSTRYVTETASYVTPTYSSVSSRSSSYSQSNPIDPIVVFDNGLDLFKAGSKEDLLIYLPEYGDRTELIIKVATNTGTTKLSGTVFGYEYENTEINHIASLILYDINNDGYRDFCVTTQTRGVNRVAIYDVVNYERLYYLEAISQINPDGYWFSLENKSLVLHRGSNVDTFDETNDWAFMKYSSATGVYGEWFNHIDLTGFNLNIRDENMQVVRSCNVNDTNLRYSLVLNSYKTYWFCITPSFAQNTWASTYLTETIKDYIHFGFCNNDTQFRSDATLTPSGIEPAEFPLYFAYYDVSTWVSYATIQILCSGYVLTLELYLN